MKKEDVPQDLSALGKITKEVCYATDGTGKYVTALSDGWDVKITALDTAWEEIRNRVSAAKEKVLAGEASPLFFFMELRLMNLQILSDYTGFWRWQIKRHLKPAAFNKLSEKQLKKYAEAFNVRPEKLKTMTIDAADTV